MDASTKIKQGILLSIYSGDKTYSDIRLAAELSPATLKEYLPRLAKEGLIKIDDKGWKRGKSKPCFITEAGIKWLINTSLFDFLKVFSSILNDLKKPENREVFRKVREEKFLQTRSLFRKHFFESAQKGVDPFEELKSLTEWEYYKKFRIIDMDQLLLEALKKLFILIMYFWTDPSEPEVTEQTINTHYIIFGKRMWPFLIYRLGSRPELDFQLQQIQNEIIHGPASKPAEDAGAHRLNGYRNNSQVSRK